MQCSNTMIAGFEYLNTPVNDPWLTWMLIALVMGLCVVLIRLARRNLAENKEESDNAGSD